MSRIEPIAEGVTLYLGDCREILPTLGKMDAVVTDPPYGINADLGAGRGTKKWTEVTGDSRWDERPIDDGFMAQIIAVAPSAIIWGGNYYAMPPTSCWLIWDKETAGITTFADCEVAWTNLSKAMRLKRHLWSGPYMKVKEHRCHPTQKPLEVMLWAIDQLPKGTASILDPFMGSGSTGVAAVSRGLSFTGIEIDPKYFDVSCRRVEDAIRRPDMFVQIEKRASEIQTAFEYNADDDIAKSVQEGFRAVKERVAAGGPGWPSTELAND